jgi:hypothetical protein
MFPKSDREDVMSKTTTTSRVLRPGDFAQTPFSSLGRKVGFPDKWPLAQLLPSGQSTHPAIQVDQYSRPSGRKTGISDK